MNGCSHPNHKWIDGTDWKAAPNGKLALTHEIMQKLGAEIFRRELENFMIKKCGKKLFIKPKDETKVVKRQIPLIERSKEELTARLLALRRSELALEVALNTAKAELEELQNTKLGDILRVKRELIALQSRPSPEPSCRCCTDNED